MAKAVLLALAASLFTATSSVCQRIGANASGRPSGFDTRILFRLARRPVWLLGVAAMVCGFGFQISALRFGGLAVVQPILATELLFVFAALTLIGARPVRRHDWLAVAAMAVGLGGFLFTASPSGGQSHASGWSWWLAGILLLGVVTAATALGFGSSDRHSASPTRRAAILGIATGMAWGFVAAVIKEMSSHLSGGVVAVATNWSLYVLIASGAASMLLASHALSAGPLAASQPGFTIMDPIAASLLGVFVFGEHLHMAPLDLAGELAALGVLLAGVLALSHSQLVTTDRSDPHPATAPGVAVGVDQPGLPGGGASPALTFSSATPRLPPGCDRPPGP
jgi:drug/metabolite transporter (DMT)-like permease